MDVKPTMTTAMNNATQMVQNMSLKRAFTARRNRHEDKHVAAAMPIGRAASQRAGRPVLRNKISSPLQLTSTTNTLIDYVPNITGTTTIPRSVSSASSASTRSAFAEDSDVSTPTGSVDSDDITDASSVDESPAPNHLSCYFKPTVESSSPVPSRSPSVSQRESVANAPNVPRRAPSHSKKAHERLNRKRSIVRMMSPARASHELARSSADVTGSQRSSLASAVEAPLENPFVKELAQLDEVAEEFGNVVRDAEADADEVFLESHGLACYGASAYADEIQDLTASFWADADEQSTTVQHCGSWV